MPDITQTVNDLAAVADQVVAKVAADKQALDEKDGTITALKGAVDLLQAEAVTEDLAGKLAGVVERLRSVLPQA